MTALGPGSLVKCIKSTPWVDQAGIVDHGPNPVFGHVYRIVDVEEAYGLAWVACEGFRHRYLAGHFTPVDDTALDVFRTTNTDLPEDVEVA